MSRWMIGATISLLAGGVSGCSQFTKGQTMIERAGAVTFKGKPLTLVGADLPVGSAVPDFVVQANDMSDVHVPVKGKVCVIITVPSLDTSVCDHEAHRFNEEATKLGDQVQVLAISMDLPFAQARWCAAGGIKNVRTLSDHRDAAAGGSLGVLIKELRLEARAVFVVDPAGKLAYKQLVTEMTHEPDYDAALAAVKKLTGK
jgi:thioredoxin-dependent peroxiredoxin